MKVDRVEVTDFQAHESLKVKLGPGVNVVVGPTDSGKSSLVRALRWALLNEPLGQQFRRPGSELTRVAVQLASGSVIERLRGQRVNRYMVDGVPYDDFGRGVPDPVTAAVGPMRVRLAGRDVDIGFQLQHDPAFMLAWTASGRAAVIDSLAGNDLVQVAVTESNKDAGNLGRAEADAERRAGKLREKVEAGSGLDAELETVGAVEKATAAARDSFRKAGQLTELAAAAEKVVAMVALPAVGDLRAPTIMINQARACAGKASSYKGLAVEAEEAIAWSAKQGAASALDKEIDALLDDLRREVAGEERCPLCLQDLGEGAKERVVASVVAGDAGGAA